MGWERLFDRTIFFVIFEHVVLLCVAVTAFLIPDMPGGLKKRIKLQNHRIQEIMIKESAKDENEGQKQEKPNQNPVAAPYSTTANKKLMLKNFIVFDAFE